MMDFGGKDVAGNGNQSGSEDSQDLTSQESGGQTARPERMVVPAGADNVVELPAGTALDTIEVEGRDLVIVLSDGTEIVIPDGAIVVPQIQIGEVTVPPANLAALMIGNEPEPAAGSPQSSGGNFAGAVGDIQAAYGLGDLLPYTELQFPQPEEREVIPYALGEPEIVIETPDNPGGVINAIATVDEAGLPARDGESEGTNEPSNSEIANGTIIFSAPDGVGSVLINGVPITEVGQTFVGEYGTLTITSIDFEGGTIGFFFTLQDNLVGETVDGSFVMTVIDIDGDRADANLQIIVRDDAPIARDDSATQSSEDAWVDVDVFQNDTPGADSVAFSNIAAVEDSLSGSGELVYNGNGTFTYKPAPGEEGTVTFQYTITDGDESPATATVTITLQPDSVPEIGILEGSDTEVEESALPFGSDPDSDGETARGALTFNTGNDDVKSLVIDGVDVTEGGTVKGEFGTLVVTGNPDDGYTYEYTLTVNTDNAGGAQIDAFEVVLTDSDDDRAETLLNISIVDDQPVAMPDTDSVTEDGPLIASGNVITDAEANGDNGADTPGADGANIVAVEFEGTAGTVGEPLKGAYGELTLDAEGKYTYELDNSNELVQGLDSTETLTEVFTYTLRDTDGSPSVTTLTITINGADDDITISGLDVPGGELTVDEDDLADGSSPDAAALVQSSSFTVDSPDGLESLTVGGVAVFGEGVTYPVTVTGTYGEVRITEVTLTMDAAGDIVSAKVDYEYELSDNTTAHPDSGQDSLTDSFEVVAFDTNGPPAISSLDVNVIDDVPQAEDDYGGLIKEGGSAAGDVLADGIPDEAGADGFATGAPIIGIASVNMGTSDTTMDASGNYVLGGEYGTLTLNKNGSYTYKSNAGSTEVDATESFTYTVIDADGDQSTATLTIDIEDVAGQVSDNDVLVNEAGLPAGSDAGSGSVIFDGKITVEGATGDFTYQLTGANSDGDGQYGSLVLDTKTGLYTYTLDTPFTDGDTAENTTNTVNGAEVFDYRVVDSLGNEIGTGTIVVNIVDDVPTARDELPRSIAEDASAPAELSGNVLTNDTLGADDSDARVTSVNIAGVDYDVAANGTTTVNTANGEYTFKASGEWTFDPTSGLDQSSGDIDASFTYTLTDTDDDFSTATQSISITDGAGPEPGDPINLVVDDQNLADGSDPNPPVTDVDTITFTPGSDAIVSIIFDDSSTALDNLGGGLDWSRESDTLIIGRDGATTIVTIELTPDLIAGTATVEVTLVENYNLHIGQGDIAADLGSLLVVAADLDGDKASAAVSVSVSDDLPTLEDREIPLDTLVVDESDFATDATADFSGFFSPDYNADNDSGAKLDGWKLGINPGSTGLVDTESGEAVVLSLEGGVVVGRTALGGIQVFTVSVDGSGNVKLDQDRALIHSDTTDHDDPVRLDAANLITLSATATDSDGDFVTKTAMIGNSLTFRDDGPSIEAKAEDLDTVKLTTQDADTIGAASDTDTSSANFGNIFKIVSSDYGADDAGDIDWDFELVLLNGTSGLFSDGVAVVLSYDGNDIVGKAGGNDVFRLHVDPDSGVVTLTQYAELDHALPGDTAAPYDDQLISLGTGLVSLQGKVTITDGDDDTASDTKSIDLGGNIFFADDGPQISGAEISSTVDVDESDAGSLSGYPISDTSASAMVTFTGDFGADGPAASNATSYTITIVGDGTTSLQTAQGDMPITLVQTSANTITGVYDVDDKTAFTVVINNDPINGYGTVTLTQEVPLEHSNDGGPGAAHDDTLSLGGLIEASVTLTDGDGDTASDSAQIGGGILFFDDGPQALANATVLLDDDALSGGNPGGTGDDANSANTTGTLGADFGGDGAGSFAFLTTDAPSGFRYVPSGSGNILVQQDQGGSYVTVLTVTLDTTTGAYTVTQNNNILHAGGNDENNQSFTLNYRITDADGDTDEGTLAINVDDDTPAPVTGSSTGTVDEDGLAPDGIAGGTADVAGEETVATGFVTSLFSVGADNPLTYSLDTDTTSLPVLYSGGVLVTYGVSGNTLTASAGADPVFTFGLNSLTGEWTFTLLGPLDHPTGDDENAPGNDIEIDFGGLIIGTDADNDPIAATGSVVVTVDDDSPVAQDDVNSLTEDTATVAGNVLTDGMDDGFGADGPGISKITAVTGTANGTVGGETPGTWGTLELGPEGAYIYTLDTAAVQFLDTNETRTDTFTYTIIDADGDTSTATLEITINGLNDAPVPADDTNWILDVTTDIDPTTSGNVLEDQNHAGAPSGNFADVADTDVDGDTLTVTQVQGVDIGGAGESVAGVHGSIEIASTGGYTYTLNADDPMVDALDDGETLTDTFTYTITDGDVTRTATVEITIFGTNDAPTIEAAAVAVSDEGFATGNPDTVGNPSDNSNSTQFLTGDLNVADVDTNDDLEVTLGTPSAGLPIKIADGATGTELSWETQNNDHTLVGYVSDPSDPSVVIVVADDGTFTVEILDPIYHSDTSNEDIDTFTIPVSVSDGTASSPATITVTLEDDSPVIGVFSPASTSVDNQDGATAPGTFQYSPGGDNHGEFSITYTGTPIDGVSYSTVQIDSDMDGINDSAILTASAGGQDLYTLEVDTDGNYLFTLVNAEVAVQEDISFSNLSAGGPGFRELLDDDATTSVDETGRVEFFVDDPANDPQVNANNNNFGVGDAHLDAGEHFNMEFHNPGAIGDDAAGTNPEFLSSIAINVNTIKPGTPGGKGPDTTLDWTATNTETGDTESGTVLVTGTGDVLIDPSIEFNQLRIENVDTVSPTDGARIQIGGVTVFKTILPSDQLLDFEISASDRDGDVTAVSDLSVLIDTSGSSSSSSLSTASFDVSPLSMTTMLDSTMAHAANDSFQQGDTFADLAFSSRMGDRAAGIASMTAAASAFAMHTTISSSHTRAFSDGGVSHEVAQISVDTLAAHAPTQAEGFAGIQSVIDAEPDMQLANAPAASSRLLDAMDQPHDGPSVMATADEAGFARVYDLGGEHSPAPVFDFASHPVAGMDAASGAGMEALLLMAAEGKGPVEGDAVADAADALTTITQEAAVDHVIDFFAQADGDHGAGPAVSITHDAGMTALLDAKIDVGDVAAHAAVPVDDMAMALDAIASA